MSVVLQIGAGGVGGVVAHKLAMNKTVFSRIILASRNISKCKKIANSIEEKGYGDIHIDSVNADDVDSVVKLIEKYKPKIVINVALPYQNLSIMEACIKTKTHYLDTANYEHPNNASFEYKEQWAMFSKFKEQNIFALLGSGFDPGVTNVFCAYAQKHYFDEIHFIDILDCNAGDHGYPFATNFNPEINLREVSSKGKFWASLDFLKNPNLNPDLTNTKNNINNKNELVFSDFPPNISNGKWVETEPLELMKIWNYPEIGEKDSYLLYHEEMESLIKNINGLKRIRFFMTFGKSYISHMECLKNVGMLDIKEVEHDGHKIIPIQFLKTLLPDPASLASHTKGKTNIGCVIKGLKNGKEREIYIYNICDHEECFKEVNSQAISYTTGIPAMIGAKLICEELWGINAIKKIVLENKFIEIKGGGVFNMEENDPDFFMRELGIQGLPWKILEKGEIIEKSE